MERVGRCELEHARRNWTPAWLAHGEFEFLIFPASVGGVTVYHQRHEQRDDQSGQHDLLTASPSPAAADTFNGNNIGLSNGISISNGGTTTYNLATKANASTLGIAINSNSVLALGGMLDASTATVNASVGSGWHVFEYRGARGDHDQRRQRLHAERERTRQFHGVGLHHDCIPERIVPDQTR